MNTRWMALLAIGTLTQASELAAQVPDGPGVRVDLAAPGIQNDRLAFVARPASVSFAPAPSAAQAVPGSKSPGLAGVLSAFILPGAGSFYGGNEGHGIRHVVIGGVSAVAVAASAGDCDIVFGSDDSTCGVFIPSVLVFVGNWVWSIVAAVNDAKTTNRALGASGLRIAPELVVVDSGSGSALGLRLVRFGL